MKTIGVISDTHGKLPGAALDVLKGRYSADQVIRHEAIDESSDAGIAEPAPCDLIAHAGDVGNPSEPAQWILDMLQEVAALVAVAGNCDYPDRYTLGGGELPRFATFEECGVRFAMLHEPRDLRAAVKGSLTSPAYITPEPRVLIHGHTHVQNIRVAASGTVTVCPGSVARPREGNPPTVAIVRVDSPGRLLSVDIVAL